MEANIIEQGINLMLYGMGTVFAFLTLLVFATTLMSRITNQFFPEQLHAENTAASPAVHNHNSNAQVDPDVLVAIQEAIYQHRAKHK